MRQYIFNLTLIILLSIGVTACTTTSKVVSREVSVDETLQIHNAKVAFSQKKYVHAAELLKPLAKQGSGDAQYALGYLYFNGMGVPRDMEIAGQLFNSAAANGNENAMQALAHLPPSDSVVIDLRDKNKSLPDPVSGMAADPADKENQEIISEATVEKSGTTVSSNQQPVEVIKTIPEVSPDPGMVTTANNKDKTDAEKWIFSQPTSHYTIQLIVLTNESSMRRYISSNNLLENTVYYQTSKNGETFYTLVHGSFESYELAKKALAGLSSNLKKAKPWIANLSSIKEVLSSR